MPGPVGMAPSSSRQHTAPFLNSIVPRARSSRSGKLAQVRLVTDQRDVFGALGVLGDRLEHLRHAPAGRQRFELLDARLAADAGDEQFRGVRRARQRAGQHELELDVELLEAPTTLEARDALAGQRPLAVVGIVRPALRGDCVTNQVQLDGGGHVSECRCSSGHGGRTRRAAGVATAHSLRIDARRRM